MGPPRAPEAAAFGYEICSDRGTHLPAEITMELSLRSPAVSFLTAALAAAALAACGRQEPPATSVGERTVPGTEVTHALEERPAPKPDPYVYRTTGTIESIDPAVGRMTIRHEGVPTEEMPPGTAEFSAQDVGPLKAMQPGQRIEFSFLKDVEGELVITAFSPTPPER